MSLAGVLAVGASMAVVGLTSTAAQALPDDLAFNKAATGSTSCSANETPAKAVDGSVATLNNKWCSTAATKWLEVDLGAVENVRQFRIQHAGAGGESANYNTSGYRILMRASTNDLWTQKVTVTGNTANVTTNNIAVTQARYLLLEISAGTQPGSDGAARIYEFEAYASSRNLAYNKTATGATSCNGNETPAKAVNENDSTTSDKWCSTASTKWLEVDLGWVRDIGQFVVKHAGAGGESANYNTRGYTISVRESTGDPWTQKVAVTDNTANVTTHDLAPTYGRYIRLDVTAGTQPGYDGAARVYELEAYPTPPNAALNASVSSPCTTCIKETVPGTAVDGNLTTKWVERTGYDYIGGQWYRVGAPQLVVDLGSTKKITGIRVYHAGSGGESSTLNTRQFIVLGDGNVAYNSGTINESVTSATMNITARYITLTVTLPEQTAYRGDKTRIYEFEVYGS